jgi:hypothetical protein
LSLTQKLSKKGRFAKVSICDDGPGSPPILILTGLKNIDDSAIFCLHRDRFEVFDKISNFHRQFA